MPKTPDLSTGQINLITVNHGTKVYVTHLQATIKETSEYFFFFGGGVAFFTIIILKRKLKKATE